MSSNDKFSAIRGFPRIDYLILTDAEEAATMWMNQIKASFVAFNYGLYLAFLARLAIPTVYRTFRVSILGALPDASQLEIASQMVWINVLLEIIEERFSILWAT